jgi:hypothetical protein
MRSAKRQTVTESTLRRIVLEEVERRRRLEEGFLDTIKQAMSKLSSKAKGKVADKSKAAAERLKSDLKKLTSTVDMDQLKKFRSAYEKQKGAVPLSKLASTPEIQDLVKSLKAIESFDAVEGSGTGDTKVESASIDIDLFLIEEGIDQKIEESQLNEIVGSLATIAGAWWTAQKTVVGMCGLGFWASKLIASVMNKAGKPETAKKFENLGHHLHHLEDTWLKKTAFPLPVQYAAYAALNSTIAGKQPASYEEFKGNKEMQEQGFHALKFALLIPMAISAVTHLVHAFSNAFSALYGVSHASAEVASTAKAGTAAAKVATRGIG